MDVMNVAIWGAVGGALPDIIRIIKNRYGKFPEYLKSPIFWIGFILLVALGGFVAWLGDAKDIKAALAFGYAGPEFVSRLFGKTVDQEDRGTKEFKLFQFWSS